MREKKTQKTCYNVNTLLSIILRVPNIPYKMIFVNLISLFWQLFSRNTADCMHMFVDCCLKNICSDCSQVHFVYS